MFGRIHLWSHLLMDFHLLEVFFLLLITDSILLLIIHLIIYPISFSFSPRLYISRDWSISSRLIVQFISIWFFIAVSCLLVFLLWRLYLPRFHIWFYWFGPPLFFFHSWIWLNFNFSKNQLLLSLIWFVVFPIDL